VIKGKSNFSGITKLLVATGSGPGPIVEVINLDDSNPDLVCEDLPDFPLYIGFATGQLYNRKYPVICGGESALSNYSTRCECYSFRDGAWQSIQSLSECKSGLASAVFPNPNKEEDDILLIIGGRMDIYTALSTVESFDGTLWNQTIFADLPTTIDMHCMVKINNTMLMQSGTVNGSYSGATGSTYFFDVIQNKWSSGPKLNVPRIFQSCAVMNWVNPNTGNEEQVSSILK
jgi:hypothetical protein